MTRGLVIAALVLGGAACAKSADAPPPAPMGSDRPELVPASEIARAKEACDGYVKAACACADKVPAVAPTCTLARGEPEAIRLALEVSQSPDSTRKDVIDAQRSVRKSAKACVEELAKLPALGCP